MEDPGLAHSHQGGQTANALEAEDQDLTPVEDVRQLASFPALDRLDLSRTRVKDVSALASLGSLHRLDLEGAPVSKAQVAALRARIPQTDIRAGVE